MSRDLYMQTLVTACVHYNSTINAFDAGRIHHIDIMHLIHNNNRTEWSPIRSVIIQLINKIRLLESNFFPHEYDYRLNWMTQSSVTNKMYL